MLGRLHEAGMSLRTCLPCLVCFWRNYACRIGVRCPLGMLLHVSFGHESLCACLVELVVMLAQCACRGLARVRLLEFRTDGVAGISLDAF